MSTVITRFAPSPTGFLHIGGARTALFNWLYAKRHGGRMMLRIEDTDRERSTQAAIDAIIDGMKWLGLDWDGDIIYQFSRAVRHQDVAKALLASGKAYYCYASQQELDEMRELARAEKRPPRYDGRWRDRDASQAPEGVSPVVRIKAPLSGETIIEDAVQGRVVFPNKDIDDFVLLRSDGTPTYMLAVVVDDHDMGVTQIIRGDDHLTNAARQTVIYEAMGWRPPAFAHIPLIHGQDGAKLSKRHGALGVSLEEMIAAFDLGQVHRSPARFDYAKLENMNGHYLRDANDDDLLKALIDTLPYLTGGVELAQQLDVTKQNQLRAALPGLKARAKTLNELVDGAAFIFAKRPLPLDEKAQHLLNADARARLAVLGPKFEGLETWDAQSTETIVRETAENLGVKLGEVAQPLRAALTGRATSPGIFDVLEILGREESIARIKDQSA
ncbi:MAG: glutamate--tRNA ligase [Methylocystaceae bacterium]|nr:glutamate--tRNA ligase [Methylocystaceae bacterium]